MNVVVISLMIVAMFLDFTAQTVTGPGKKGEKNRMSQYILLLHETPSDYAEMSVDDMQRIIGEYVAWKQSIEAQGRLAGSNKLADEGGRYVTKHGGEVRVTDGPYAEAKEVMGGYFIVTAASYDEAVEIARTCPHLSYGGWIEIRKVEEVGEAAAGR